MSINVTVTGNPVSIKRGKLITSDPNHVQAEFQKRRRLRLEQVRQQSKDIAENVRNKVKKEKSKALSNFDKENESKLRQWKNRRLMELESQLSEDLKNIGLGHAQAIAEEAAEIEFITRRDEENSRRARERGHIAMEKQQVNKNEESLKKAVPKQMKKMVRDVENRRAEIVASTSKTKRRRKSAGEDVDFSYEEESDNEIPVLDISGDESQIESAVKEVRRSNKKFNSPKKSRSESPKPDRVSEWTVKSARIESNKDTGHKSLKFNEKKRVSERKGSLSPTPASKFSENAAITISSEKSFEVPLNTRISERIRKRNIPPVSAIPQDSSLEEIPREIYHEENRKTYYPKYAEKSKTESGNSNKKLPNKQRQPQKIVTTAEIHKSTSRVPTEIPSKPTISIRETSNETTKTTYSKVNSYDHDTRFTKNYIVDNSNVRKISDESIQVLPSEGSECQFQEMQFQREIQAERRGQEALNKEKIQRDYQNLMKKLPILKKQERIASLDPGKDKFHKSNDRLKEYERVQQQRMEEAYEKLVPNTITIPPKVDKKIEESPPFKVVEHAERTIPFWKEAETTKSTESSKNLHLLLEVLKLQKEQLLKEADKKDEKVVDTNKVKRTVSTSPFKKDKTRKSSASSLTTVASTRCKSVNCRANKNRKDILILQNMSTQTSPKVASPVEVKNVVEVKSCECKDSKSDNRDKLCEILIKIQQDYDKSEVIVNSSKKHLSSEIKKGESEVEVTTKAKKKVVKEVEKTPSDVKITNVKNRSSFWEEQFSKNDTTSSTSYYSPPVYNCGLKQCKFTNSQQVSSSQQTTKDPSTNTQMTSTKLSSLQESGENPSSNLLKNKPQQSNLDGIHKRPKKIHPELLHHIKKLLEMSRSRIDNLNVTSVSEVSTPSSSVINTEANNPELALMNLLKSFNLNINDVVSNLTQNQTNSNRQSTQISDSNNASNNKQFKQKSMSFDSLDLPDFSSNPNVISNGVYNETPVSYLSKGNAGGSSKIKETHQISGNNTKISSHQETSDQVNLQTSDPRSISLEDYTQLYYPNLIANRYNELADMCQKRIKNLAAMIEKVRSEKQQMLSPNNSNGSEKDNVTSYLNLPSHLGDDSKSDRTTSPEQIELTKKLLQIEIDNVANSQNRNPILELTNPEFEADFLKRYADLINVSSKSEVSPPKQEKSLRQDPNFVPFLLDIPKLPKFVESPSSSSLHTTLKKPPTAKALAKLGELNEGPHELSMIPEGDSTRLSKSPVKDSIVIDKITSLQIIDDADDDSTSSSTSKMIAELIKTTTNNAANLRDSKFLRMQEANKQVAKILEKLKDVSTDTSTEKSEIDIEEMLKSMGMSWAIATLRKTQEALAQGSSTSSMDQTKNESSEVTLKSFLKNLSNSDSSIPSFVRGLQNNSTSSVNKQHRTSTPVQTTKSSEKNDSKRSNETKDDKWTKSNFEDHLIASTSGKISEKINRNSSSGEQTKSKNSTELSGNKNIELNPYKSAEQSQSKIVEESSESNFISIPDQSVDDSSNLS